MSQIILSGGQNGRRVNLQSVKSDYTRLNLLRFLMYEALGTMYDKTVFGSP